MLTRKGKQPRHTLVLCVIAAILMCTCSISHAVLIYGHRGARGLAPENTLAAYQVALRLGVDMLDMDVNMTKDGVLVVTHNYALNPDITQNKKGQWITEKKLIKDLTWKQLQEYDVGKIKPGTFYHSLFPDQIAIKGSHIPRLKEVIESIKHCTLAHVGYQIEIKTNPEHPNWTFSPEIMAKAVAKIIQEEKIIEQTEVQAFDFRVLLALQKINPHIKTAYLTEVVKEDLLDKINLKKASLWTAGYLLKNFNNSIPQMIAKLGGNFWEPEDTEVNEEQIKLAHKLGLKVVVWSYPEKAGKEINLALLERLVKWGVDGIITDHPDVIRVAMRNLQ